MGGEGERGQGRGRESVKREVEGKERERGEREWNIGAYLSSCRKLWSYSTSSSSLIKLTSLPIALGCSANALPA